MPYYDDFLLGIVLGLYTVLLPFITYLSQLFRIGPILTLSVWFCVNSELVLFIAVLLVISTVINGNG